MKGWSERAYDAGLADALASSGCSRILARLLAARGVSACGLDEFFEPTLADLAGKANPSDLPGIDAAVSEILAAVSRGERIVVFGDYDCDGVCATAILMLIISLLAGERAKPVAFLPERLPEGYGMSEASIARMLKETPDVRLVVTVDNGINAAEHVAALAARGVRTVVTDHHLPGDELPAAVALVNPKVAAPDSLRDLCGAGVAFLLAQALMTAAKERSLYSGPSVGGPPLVLAGLATVTDIMPLTGVNRILVHNALKHFSALAPLGLKELFLRAARTASKEFEARDFGFLIGPRINAAGRMASGMDALNLILSTDREEARELARQVDLRNIERKSVEHEMLKDALSQVEPGAAAHVINLPHGHEGVAGIVAARVLEQAAALPGSAGSVPVAVVVGTHGSARAPAGYNVRDALECAAGVLDRYGGHAAAGGFSVKDGEQERFRELFSTACAAQAESLPDEVRGVSSFDGWVAPEELTLELLDDLRRMEPFGEGNPEPLFGLRGVHLSDVRPLGADGRHLALAFRERAVPKAIWWNRGNSIESLRAQAASACDIIFTVEANDYQGRHVELRLVDLAPSTAS